MTRSELKGISEQVLRTLEFHKIQEILSSYAKTPLGKARIENLKPIFDLETIKWRQTLTDECKEILTNIGNIPLANIPDVRKSLGLIHAEGYMLEPEKILQIMDLLVAAKEMHKFNRQLDPERPLFNELASQIRPQNLLERHIRQTFDERGRIKDEASETLYNIRREIDKIKQKIEYILEGILHNNRYEKAFQDKYITERSGRLVLPVLSNFRGLVKGIVHHSSTSGTTVFIEPEATVELGNKLVAFKEKEDKEIRKILLNLTDEISLKRYEIETMVDVLGIIDQYCAQARYSYEYNMNPPDFMSKNELMLIQARHPILLNLMKTVDVVPIDVEVGHNYEQLIITGPNTGGKTVALKTVGLLALMAQAGMHIPAVPGCRLPVFQRIFADIGDEQDIEGSLSTFSSHMGKIKDFLKQADRHSLVLIDELGTGTDPAEGSALGMAVLKKLHKFKCLVLATTHHEALKTFAYTENFAENASVEFSRETLQPKYRLLTGVPGESNAFYIAERLEVPPDVIADARSYLSGLTTPTREVMERLQQDSTAAISAREEMESRTRLARKMEDEARRKLDDANRKALRLVEEAREEALQIVADLQRKSEFLLDKAKHQLKEMVKKGEAPPKPEVFKEIRELRKEQDEKLEQKKKKKKDKKPKVTIDNILIGHRYRIVDVGQEGSAVDRDKKRNEVTLEVRGLQVKVAPDRLQLVDIPEKPDVLQREEEIEEVKKEDVNNWLNVVGLRVDEALDAVDKYLDDVMLSSYKQVTVIHGVGTGALKNSIAKFLDEHPSVISARSGEQWEGGDGVTIVTIEADAGS